MIISDGMLVGLASILKKGSPFMSKIYFEPTGRLIMSIGRDLIKDSPAALVELVKNSYDADATYVNIDYARQESSLRITVHDDGHGMSPETVLNSWMTPATDYKLKKKTSPNGRIYQGRKGIGRYAVSLLGNKLELETVNEGKKTIALFDWENFETAKKLNEIPIDYEVVDTNEKNGTKLTIINEKKNINDSFREELSENDVSRIEKEMSKLLFGEEAFKIVISYSSFFVDEAKNTTYEVGKYSEDLAFHYRLKGRVDNNFDYHLFYENGYSKAKKEFKGSFLNNLKEFKNLPSCGSLSFDYKVYDKDSQGIEVITDFLNNSGNIKPLTKNEAKKLLIENSGISIYRNGFRIRPYGDKGFDWLNLDSKRVQNPSMDIGFDQINGRIEIGSEEVSGLKEKSARDGLYENENYFVLQKVADWVLDILEKERFIYRKKKPENKNNEKAIEKLFDFSTTSSNIENEIQKTIEKIESSPERSKEYYDLLKKNIGREIEILEQEKQDTFFEIKEEVAIYQKHATLGNVIDVVLHEGRKPLTWFSHTIPRLIRKFNRNSGNKELQKELFIDAINELGNLKKEAERLSRFFSRLDPLSSSKRKKAKKVNIKLEIENVVDIFSEYIKELGITIFLNCSSNIEITIIEEDIYMALTNIIENSIFWTKYSIKDEKLISILVTKSEKELVIDIIDNGPGISDEDIQNGIIFIPGYSGKKIVSDQSGTGLGLAIAGEALLRNNATLEAVKSENGAHFRIKLLEEVKI